ncbi:F0F1 ATP synthase subunit delta, partial [Francisella tularensis]|uniref:F0F1 ATP synthase subunit delta n=1 Tax=Francisella tularensis TaxID=263 RepID=UPI002381BF30
RVADVTLAYATDKNILDSLKTRLEKKFGCTIDIHINIDPAIIGGAVVKVGYTVIDSSVSGHLEKLNSILLSYIIGSELMHLSPSEISG